MSKPEIVVRAVHFARAAHRGQERDDGQPFLVHPLMVAQILTLVGADNNLIAAGVLHDVIEDTFVTYNGLVDEFGEDIADLVNEVSHEGSPDSKGFYFPRLHSQRGIMLKFADRLSNISDMKTWDTKRQAHYLRKSKFWKGEENVS